MCIVGRAIFPEETTKRTAFETCPVGPLGAQLLQSLKRRLASSERVHTLFVASQIVMTQGN